MIRGSVVDYPERSRHGRANWPGNVSGNLIRDLLETHRPGLFCDPACGSNTSGDVVAEMNREGYNIEYHGLDLHSGYDITSDPLAERLPREADYIFFDPPFHNIHVYSGRVWGTQPHPNDLSRCESVEDFLSKLERGLLNLYEAVRRGGRYSVKIGDLRMKGVYHALQAQLIAIAPGLLDSIIIKKLHNCRSDGRTYRNNLILIEHEYVITWRRDGVVFGMFDAALATSDRLRQLSGCTWRAVVEYALEMLGGRASLEELYHFIEQRAGERIRSVNWQAKIRQTVQRCAVRLERGVWASRSYQPQTAAA